MNEHTNGAFEMSPDEKAAPLGRPSLQKGEDYEKQSNSSNEKDGEEAPQRAMWGNQIEFLMSCIATSVGLGNVWRFPFVAFENGGGAFLIPYVIVLILVGKPMYYLECVLGQFSSKNSVKVWSLSPAFKGTGYSQAMGCGYILSYYVSIVALCLYYLAMSFNSVLPWAVCEKDWIEQYNCIDSGESVPEGEMSENATSSAELYFLRTVLRQLDNIDNGIGAPLWDLTLCLLASWFIIFLIVAQGVKSSGKAAYFLAIFPYIIMIILLIRSATLDGASSGILFFLTPQWDKLLELNVWYAAVTQVFFSLSVCTGAIIMFSSYNDFRQNIYRDAMIVTTLDTFTSLMSGITIFGILGSLAKELGYGDDVTKVMGSGGAGLAFVSYPDAIAKSPFAPQLFAVLFFLMMSVLGVGSSVALLSTLNTLLYDAFPKVRTVYMSAIACTIGFISGLVYVTPGGQFILELVDYYGGTFLVLFAAIAEIIGVFWVYGLETLCLDIEYMLNIKTSFYWRMCWGIITPFMMIAVFIFALISSDSVKFAGIPYPVSAHVCGYILLFAGILLVPIFIIVTLVKSRTGNCGETLKVSFNAKPSWGPRSAREAAKWRDFKAEAKVRQKGMRSSGIKHVLYILVGGYRWRA